MSEAPKDLDSSAGLGKEPDYFQYFLSGVTDLLSQEDDFLPFSSKNSESAKTTSEVLTEKEGVNEGCAVKESKSSVKSDILFSDAAGAELSDFKKERLKAMLRQGVVTLACEVNDMLDPVLALCELQGRMGLKRKPASIGENDVGIDSLKKSKLSSSPSSLSSPHHATPLNHSLMGEVSRDEQKGIALPGKSCSLKDQNKSVLVLDEEDEKEAGEVNDDMRILLESDESLVKEMMKKTKAELSATLEYMDQKLEEFLDIVMSSCRPMTLAEKHQLKRLIHKLPPKNLDRIAEIICHKRPSEEYSHEEIHVDLEKEDDITLWRLYFYVKTVDEARLLVSSKPTKDCNN